MRQKSVVFRKLLCLVFLTFIAVPSVIAQQNQDFSERANVSGVYPGTISFPEDNINGTALLTIEGNKFVLQNGADKLKSGRITAIDSRGGYLSVTMMFDEDQTASPQSPRKVLSLRLIKANKRFSITNAPDEPRSFSFELTTPIMLQQTAQAGRKAPAATKPQAEKFDDIETDSSAQPKPKVVVVRAVESGAATSNLQTPVGQATKSNAPSATIANDTVTTQSISIAEKPAVVAPETKIEKPAAVAVKPQIEEKPQTEISASPKASPTSENAAASEIRQATQELRQATVELRTATGELQRARALVEKINAAPKNAAVETAQATAKKSGESKKPAEKVAPTVVAGFAVEKKGATEAKRSVSGRKTAAATRKIKTPTKKRRTAAKSKTIKIASKQTAESGQAKDAKAETNAVSQNPKNGNAAGKTTTGQSELKTGTATSDAKETKIETAKPKQKNIKAED